MDVDDRSEFCGAPRIRTASEGSAIQRDGSDIEDSVSVLEVEPPVRPAWLRWLRRPAGRFVRPADDLSYLLTLIAAAAIFAITTLIVYELFIGSALARAKFG